MPWLKKPSPLKGNPTKKDTSRYCEFHEGHDHYTNDCFAWKKHLEELVEDGHCTEFIARGAIQKIKDPDHRGAGEKDHASDKHKSPKLSPATQSWKTISTSSFKGKKFQDNEMPITSEGTIHEAPRLSARL
ncbi:unnamed protein product [Prunus brigantina]